MYYDEEMTFEEEQAEHDFENQMHESTKQAEKQCDIHVVVDGACLCEQNARGQVVSGWCRKHHTDWM
jgi:hypothetical protein